MTQLTDKQLLTYSHNYCKGCLQDFFAHVRDATFQVQQNFKYLLIVNSTYWLRTKQLNQDAILQELIEMAQPKLELNTGKQKQYLRIVNKTSNILC
jgi:hypothetical protein